jgi:hypothetical protein
MRPLIEALQSMKFTVALECFDFQYLVIWNREPYQDPYVPCPARQLGNRGRKTGFTSEFAAPCYAFKGAGAEIVLAWLKGGQPRLGPKTNEPSVQTDLTHRFEADVAARAQLDSIVRLERLAKFRSDKRFAGGLSLD